MNGRDDNMYLERIELSNFRAYGENFSLDLPNGPGITMVYGPNGLGKTTLFDAVEWCLTGGISRFAPYLPGAANKRTHHLTRLGATEGSHRVTLSFTGLEPIDRGRGFDPATAELAQLLKRPEWPEVGDLSRYLSMTHFLGQSAAQRFSVKQPKDQWEALKGPAGIDRVNHIKDRIGGNATRQAFNRYLKQAESDLSAAKQALENWNALIDKLAQLRSLSKSAEALTPAEILELCVSAIQRLNGLEAESRGGDALGNTPESALEQVRLVLAGARQRLTSEMSKIETLDNVTKEVVTVRTEQRSSAELATVAERRHVAASSELARAEDAFARAGLERERARQAKSDAEVQLQLVARIGESLTVLEESSIRVSTIELQLPSITASVAAADARAIELSNTLKEIERRGEQRQGLAERVRRLRAAAPLMRELEALGTSMQDQGDRDAMLRELGVLSERRARLEIEERKWLNRITQSEEQLDAHDRRSAHIAAAVSQVAASLSVADVECPVCRTKFEPGELVELLRAGHERPSIGTRELAETLATARVELVTITSALEELDSDAHALRVQIVLREETEAKALSLQTQIAELAGRELAGSEDELQKLIIASESELQTLDIEIRTAPSEDDLRSEVTTLDASRVAEVSRAARLRAELADVLAQEETARATLRRYPDLWTEESGLLRPLDELRSSAAESVAVAIAAVQLSDDAFTATSEEVDRYRREVVEALSLRDEHRQRQMELAARQSELMNTWVALKMPGEPDAGVVWQERDRLNDALRIVNEVADELERAHVRYRSWLEDEQLAVSQREAQRLMDGAGASDEREMADILRSAVAGADRRLSRAARTKQKADEVVQVLKDMATTYAFEVLEPLNESIQEFATTLLTRADGSLLYRAEQHLNRSALRPGIVRTDVFGQSEPLDMNPNLFFSEGQLSALSVSALLAASTNFRWSRWPALLMDDPLQHNDVIHASAFIDLMRRLVTQLGYQVVLSSHDAAEVDFIARKCRSAGIRYAQCELMPAGESGIVSARP